jgi:hypothetical protein
MTRNRKPIWTAALALVSLWAFAPAPPVFAQKPPPAPSRKGVFPKQRKPSPPARIITIKPGQTKLAPGQLTKAPTVDQWQKTARKHQKKVAATPRPLRLPRSMVTKPRAASKTP